MVRYLSVTFSLITRKKKMSLIMSLSDFVEQYAKDNNLTKEQSEVVVWAKGAYKKYTDQRRAEFGIESCEDCGTDGDVKTFYCSNFGCGGGKCCKKNEYKLCFSCDIVSTML